MKRLLIGVIAVAGLLGSVLAVAAAVTSPASAQTSSVELVNATRGAADEVTSLTQVIVSVRVVNECNAGANTPLKGGSYSLNGGITSGSAGGSDITGVLSASCSWQVTFRNGGAGARLCAVNAVAREADGTAIGNPVSSKTAGGMLLVGVGSGRLQFQGTGVASIAFTVDTTDCSVPFSPTIQASLVDTIPPATTTDPNSGQGKYNRVQVPVSFAPVENSNAGCTQSASVTLTFDEAGSATVAEAPSLIHTPLGVTAGCVYGVSYADEAGALRLVADSATATVSNASSNATAQYDAITVQISVTSTFPTDEVFTTQDKVDYFINVDAPCGGYLGVIPQAFGSQGDVASAQVFPGSVTVYGAALNQISVDQSKTYTVEAYADGQGTMPCTVRVSERNGPERCVATGGESQERTYATGTSVFAFEFNHTCTPAVATGGAVDAGGADDGGIPTPPTPPAIDLGGGTGATDTPAGPAPEGQTG